MSLPATLEYFNTRKDRKSGLTSWCKPCIKIKNKTYYDKNAEKIIEGRKQYYQAHKEERRDYERLRYKKRYDSNPEYYIKYTNIHKWVRKRKIKPKYCSICNQEKKLQLANISGEYQKNINDYLWLCQECHYLYDKNKL